MIGFYKRFCAFLFFLLPLCSKAEILPPSFGNVTYVSKGSQVNITWGLNFGINLRFGDRKWTFQKFGEPKSEAKILADIFSGKLEIQPTPLPGINITLPATLILNNVDMNYNGTYLFVIAVKGVAEAIQPVDVKVIILEQPLASVGRSSPLVVNEGENISCLCNSTGGNPPPTASWYTDGTLIEETGYLKKNLMLTNVSKYDSGNYTCRVQSHNLIDEEYVNITVLYKPIITLFEANSSADYVAENSAVVFTCKVDALPTANIKILHNGNNVTGLNGDVAVYTISSVNSGHSGTYQCVAENGVDTTSSHSITLKVAEKPTAVVNCSNEIPITVNEGDSVSCVCNSTGGVPTPKAWWIKDGTTVSGPTKGSNILNKTMSRNDGGTYTCKVDSIPSLSDEKIIQISVHYKPSITFNESTAVTVGASVIIYCKADGSPQPTYTLYKVKEGETVLRTSDLVLVYTIDNVSASDKGEYKCMAKNTLGSDSKTFHLNVTKPIPTTVASIPTGGTEASSSGLSTAAIAGIAIGGIIAVILVILIIWLLCFRKDREKQSVVVGEAYRPGTAENPYESPDLALVDELDAGSDSAGSSRPSTTATNTAESGLPPVYAVVEKKNRVSKKDPKPEVDPSQVTYASLDAVALQPDSSRMHERPKVESNYAAIDLYKL